MLISTFVKIPGDICVQKDFLFISGLIFSWFTIRFGVTFTVAQVTARWEKRGIFLEMQQHKGMIFTKGVDEATNSLQYSYGASTIGMSPPAFHRTSLPGRLGLKKSKKRALLYTSCIILRHSLCTSLQNPKQQAIQWLLQNCSKCKRINMAAVRETRPSVLNSNQYGMLRVILCFMLPVTVFVFFACCHNIRVIKVGTWICSQ